MPFDPAQTQHAGHRHRTLHAQFLVQLITAIAVAVTDHMHTAGAIRLERLCDLAQRYQARRQQQGTFGMEVAIHWNQQAYLLTLLFNFIALLGSQSGQADDARLSPGGRGWGSMDNFFF